MTKFFYIFAAILFISVRLVSAQETPETIPFAYVILDGSSSMWGRIDGRPKIELAKDVLTKIINSLPKKVNTGFTVYGHRKQNDCADIEDISPVGVMDKSEIIGKLNKISPRGKSPMTAAIRHVFEMIQSYEGPKTIILVSDGVESCGQDPCAYVKELKGKGVDFKFEVIGLNVTEEESKQLNCIAVASGGSYQFIKSLAQVYTPTPLPSAVPTIPILQIVQPSPYPTALPTSPGITLFNKVPSPYNAPAERPKGSITFEHESWLLTPNYWRLIDPKTGEEVIRSKNFEESEVPEGTYLLAWRQYEHGSTEVIVDNNVIVKAGSTTNVSLSTAMRMVVPSWVRPPWYWGLQDVESSEQIAAFTPFEPFLVPPGEYELIWRQYENRADTISFGRIDIDGGKMNEISIKSSISPQNAEWVNTHPYFWGLRVPDSKEYVARFYGNMEAQLIPAGRYTVVYRLSANESTDSLLGEINVSEDENKDFIIDSGVLFETKDLPHIPQSIEFRELDDKDNVVSSTMMSKSLGPLPLKPGKYSIHYTRINKADTSKDAQPDTINLKQGELLKINLDDLFHDASVAVKPTIEIQATVLPVITSIAPSPSNLLPDSQAGASASENSAPTPLHAED
jgi:hypothetical protein